MDPMRERALLREIQRVQRQVKAELAEAGRGGEAEVGCSAETEVTTTLPSEWTDCCALDSVLRYPPATPECTMCEIEAPPAVNAVPVAHAVVHVTSPRVPAAVGPSGKGPGARLMSPPRPVVVRPDAQVPVRSPSGRPDPGPIPPPSAVVVAGQGWVVKALS
eukprot:Hpha_TRINITY_DN22558_c0_g1::TRINITY_DN22558_c0_g1_i1::g.185009::m.185009